MLTIYEKTANFFVLVFHLFGLDIGIKNGPKTNYYIKLIFIFQILKLGAGTNRPHEHTTSTIAKNFFKKWGK